MQFLYSCMNIFVEVTNDLKSFQTATVQVENYFDYRLQLKNKINKLSKHWEQQQISSQNIHQALYAIIAWIDETIILSQWIGAETWKYETLQYEFFQSTSAGYEFYELLEKLSPEDIEVKEIYLWCLLFNFKGKHYALEDVTILDNYKSSLQAEILKFINQSQKKLNEIQQKNQNMGLKERFLHHNLSLPFLAAFFIIISICLYFIFSVSMSDVLSSLFHLTAGGSQ